MPERWINTLTVFAPQKELRTFVKSRWKRSLGGRFWELRENMRTRVGWQFETPSSPIPSVQALSLRWPKLVLVLQWENQTKRTMGLAKSKGGRLEEFEVRYWPWDSLLCCMQRRYDSSKTQKEFAVTAGFFLAMPS